MPIPTDTAKLGVSQLLERMRGELVPINNHFSYFCVALPLTEDDIKEYLQEPVAALPPAVGAVLPKVAVLLVPYLERGNKENGQIEDFVCFDKPLQNRLIWTSKVVAPDQAVLVFAVRDQEVADYHYRFYHQLASLVGEFWDADVQDQFSALLREELNAGAHGEVDEQSWQLKQTLRSRGRKVSRRSKSFSRYARQSFVDTLTLYLHGICCDIDVETGPRQLASRYLRRRLQLLQSLFAPPSGYAIFPEEVDSD
jgi:hypothetical protein